MYTFCLLLALLPLQVEPSNVYCGDLPAFETYDLRVTAYDPILGGINCMEPCDKTATGHIVSEWYGRGASCPIPLLRNQMSVAFEGHTFKCIDTGGAIVIDDEREEIRLDILWVLHDDNREYSLAPNTPYFIHTTLPPGMYQFYGDDQ